MVRKVEGIILFSGAFEKSRVSSEGKESGIKTNRAKNFFFYWEGGCDMGSNGAVA